MIWTIPASFLLDLLLGDPHGWPHPVIGIGRFIKRVETVLASLIDHRRLAGCLLALVTVLVTGLVTWAVIHLAGLLHSLVGLAVTVWLGYTTLALRSLHLESRQVVRYLEQGRISEARRALSLIVGRETSQLDEEQILRACIETVAENTSDGVIGPLFYLFLGGPVAAMMYKAASTLDSMVGYTDDRYREMGWASARLDDLLNLVPARLTGLLMVLASFPLGLNPWAALTTMLRDARKTSSPNAGFPESAVAGALGVRLGGPATYFGETVQKPTLGDADRRIDIGCYRATIRLMYLTALLGLILGMVVVWPLY
ncbi:adenosylcobinamide-phosphate synthase CbiB [Geothermobacter hydrogeniphilus]|uniref:Cobalamin biosynthesis protein CobD n=1 Tax=Geothermobacter hydrogeniphilus TaxID=1969733 RepID=A0A1X0Y5D2_9BACT|nr:adenosylcobinamide-phosphate synthase CbiB [Geothermobacter hydrogeniphilus]ORJ60282.1 cobalamin biosynthesis protein CobD [Geothermobacter hydrogeniphilus]